MKIKELKGHRNNKNKMTNQEKLKKIKIIRKELLKEKTNWVIVRGLSKECQLNDTAFREMLYDKDKGGLLGDYLLSLSYYKTDNIKRLNKPFSTTSVCRADIISQGFSEKEVMKLTDEDMKIIASKIADGVLESFWVALDIVIEDRFMLRKVAK